MQPTPYETLMAAFLDTQEMADWDEFITSARQQIATGAATLTVPAGFLSRVIDEIATSPLMFAAVQTHWNNHCEAHGHPEFKKEGDAGEEEPAF